MPFQNMPKIPPSTSVPSKQKDNVKSKNDAKPAKDAKPTILPPTKQQILESKVAVSVEGPTIVTNANLNKLLGRDEMAKNFVGPDQGVDLTMQQIPEFQNQQNQQRYEPKVVQQYNQQPQYNQQQFNQQHNDDMNHIQFNSNRQQQQNELRPQYGQYDNVQQQNVMQQNQYQTPPQVQLQNQQTQQQDFAQQQQDINSHKKVSDMSDAEYKEWEKKQEISNWKKLIEIIIYRIPTSVDQDQFTELQKNKQFKEMYNAEYNTERAQKAIREKESKQKKDKTGLQPYKNERGQKFNPSFEPSVPIPTGNEQIPQPLSQLQQHSSPQQQQNQPMQQQYQQQNIQQYPQNPPNAYNYQQNQQQQQQFVYQQQPPQPAPLPLPNFQQSSFLLQKISDLQMELEQQQAQKHKMEAIRLEREVSVLTDEVQAEKRLRQSAEQRNREMVVDMEQLRSQIVQLQQFMQDQCNNQQQNIPIVYTNMPQSAPRTANNNIAVRPESVVQLGDTAMQVQNALGNIRVPQQMVQIPQQNYPSYNQLNNSLQKQNNASIRKEDPNFNTNALADIDQIMKNANIVLHKYEFNESLEKNQQVKQAYIAMLNKPPVPTPPPGAEDLEKILRENVPSRIENTDDDQKPPNEIPHSILANIPDMIDTSKEIQQQFEKEASQTNNSEKQKPKSAPKIVQVQDEKKNEQDNKQDADNIGSLLPKSQFTQRNRLNSRQASKQQGNAGNQ